MKKYAIVEFQTESITRAKLYEETMLKNKIKFHKRILKRKGRSPIINFKINYCTYKNWEIIFIMLDMRDLEDREQKMTKKDKL